MSINCKGKKSQTRGGKAVKKILKKQEMNRLVLVGRAKRGRKSITLVRGLRTCEKDLKKCKQLFANKFSCGASLTGEDEISVQGEFVDQIIDFLIEKMDIDENDIKDGGDM